MLALSFFSVGVSAASDNLIESNLTQWSNLNGSFDIQLYGNNNIYRLGANGGTSKFFNGIIYDLPNFVAGHSYTLRFKLPSASEIASAWNVSFTDATYNSYYNNAQVFVGYGFVNPEGTIVEGKNLFFEFNASNISRYVGQNLSTTFVASSSTTGGRPVIFISITTTDSNQHFFFFSNFSLFDNDDNSQELSGIKGFLHSIRWDLVGGVCEEEDCPHSSDVNPHLSLTERMTGGFASFLDKIADKFEDGSTLNTWFTDLSDKVSGSVSSSSTSLGDRIKGFFDNISTKITEKYENLDINLGDWFDDVGDWFTNLKEKLTENIEAFKTAITEFSEKFKPRVYEQLIWQRGMINGSTGAVLNQPNGQNVIVSEFFEVPLGSEYLIDFFDTDHNGALQIYQYNLDGSFVGSFGLISVNTEGFLLPEGYQYRFRLVLNVNYKPSEANQIVKIYADEGWLNALVHLMIAKIKALFVPDPNVMTEFYDEMEEFMAERLGIIYEATSFGSDLLETIGDMLSGSSARARAGDAILFTIPAININLPGQGSFQLWNEQKFQLDFLSTNGFFAFFYGLYKMMLWVICIFATIKYALKTWERIMSS